MIELLCIQIISSIILIIFNVLISFAGGCTVDGNAGNGTIQGNCDNGLLCFADGKCMGMS